MNPLKLMKRHGQRGVALTIISLLLVVISLLLVVRQREREPSTQLAEVIGARTVAFELTEGALRVAESTLRQDMHKMFPVTPETSRLHPCSNGTCMSREDQPVWHRLTALQWLDPAIVRTLPNLGGTPDLGLTHQPAYIIEFQGQHVISMREPRALRSCESHLLITARTPFHPGKAVMLQTLYKWGPHACAHGSVEESIASPGEENSTIQHTPHLLRYSWREVPQL